MHISRLTIAALLLATAGTLSRADKLDLSPLIGNRTLAVGTVDLTRLAPDVAVDWFVAAAKKSRTPSQFLPRHQVGLRAIAATAKTSIDALVQAGATRAAIFRNLTSRTVQSTRRRHP